jgi:hypothetical protein
LRNLPAAGRYENGAAPGSPTREYVYSGGALLVKIESGATEYYHADQLPTRPVGISAAVPTENAGMRMTQLERPPGASISVRMITDSSGNVIGEQGHFPFDAGFG